MEFPKECEHRYRDCLDWDSCDVICKGVEKDHPYCKFASYCDYGRYEPVRTLCDGRCEYNKRHLEIKKLGEKINRLGEAKRIIIDEIEDLKKQEELLIQENKKLEEQYKNELHEFFDSGNDEDEDSED